MQAFPFEIEYYLTEEGRKPFNEWLQSLRDITARAKIRVRLDRVRLGNLGDNRSVGQGVHELRVDYGPGYRIYFAFEDNRLILLLLGGEKSGQAKDIAMAKEFWRDHKRRRQNG